MSEELVYMSEELVDELIDDIHRTRSEAVRNSRSLTYNPKLIAYVSSEMGHFLLKYLNQRSPSLGYELSQNSTLLGCDVFCGRSLILGNRGTPHAHWKIFVEN